MTEASQSVATELEALSQRFRRRLVIFAMRRLGVAALAEDAAQETLRRVSEALSAERVRDAAALPAFVYQTVRHVCQQLHRSSFREKKALQRLAHEPTSASSDPLIDLISEERRRQVRLALTALRADDRNLLELMYGQGLDPPTVAERLGLTVGTLRVRKHRALKRLGAKLGESETFWPFREPEE